jgi:hypothetical protein
MALALTVAARNAPGGDLVVTLSALDEAQRFTFIGKTEVVQGSRFPRFRRRLRFADKMARTLRLGLWSILPLTTEQEVLQTRGGGKGKPGRELVGCCTVSARELATEGQTLCLALTAKDGTPAAHNCDLLVQTEVATEATEQDEEEHDGIFGIDLHSAVPADDLRLTISAQRLSSYSEVDERAVVVRHSRTVVWYKGPGESRWCFVGKTEGVLEDHNPHYIKGVTVGVRRGGQLRLEVEELNSHGEVLSEPLIGATVVSVDTLLGPAGSVTLPLRNRNRNKRRALMLEKSCITLGFAAPSLPSLQGDSHAQDVAGREATTALLSDEEEEGLDEGRPQGARGWLRVRVACWGLEGDTAYRIDTELGGRRRGRTEVVMGPCPSFQSLLLLDYDEAGPGDLTFALLGVAGVEGDATADHQHTVRIGMAKMDLREHRRSFRLAHGVQIDCDVLQEGDVVGGLVVHMDLVSVTLQLALTAWDLSLLTGDINGDGGGVKKGSGLGPWWREEAGKGGNGGNGDKEGASFAVIEGDGKSVVDQGETEDRGKGEGETKGGETGAEAQPGQAKEGTSNENDEGEKEEGALVMMHRPVEGKSETMSEEKEGEGVGEGDPLPPPPLPPQPPAPPSPEAKQVGGVVVNVDDLAVPNIEVMESKEESKEKSMEESKKGDKEEASDQTVKPGASSSPTVAEGIESGASSAPTLAETQWKLGAALAHAAKGDERRRAADTIPPEGDANKADDMDGTPPRSLSSDGGGAHSSRPASEEGVGSGQEEGAQAVPLLSEGRITAGLWTKPAGDDWVLQERTEATRPQHDGARWETRLTLVADSTRDVRFELYLDGPRSGSGFSPLQGGEKGRQPLARADFSLTELFASCDGPLWMLELPLHRPNAKKTARSACLMVTAGLLSLRQILPLKPIALPSDLNTPVVVTPESLVPTPLASTVSSAPATPGPTFVIGGKPQTPTFVIAQPEQQYPGQPWSVVMASARQGAMRAAASKGRKKKTKGKGNGRVTPAPTSAVPPFAVLPAQPTGIKSNARPCTVKNFALSCARTPKLAANALGLIVRVELPERAGKSATVLVGHTELASGRGQKGKCVFTMPLRVPPKSRTDQMLRFKLIEVSDEGRSFDLLPDTSVLAEAWASLEVLEGLATKGPCTILLAPRQAGRAPSELLIRLPDASQEAPTSAPPRTGLLEKVKEARLDRRRARTGKPDTDPVPGTRTGGGMSARDSARSVQDTRVVSATDARYRQRSGQKHGDRLRQQDAQRPMEMKYEEYDDEEGSEGDEGDSGELVMVYQAEGNDGRYRGDQQRNNLGPPPQRRHEHGGTSEKFRSHRTSTRDPRRHVSEYGRESERGRARREEAYSQARGRWDSRLEANSLHPSESDEGAEGDEGDHGADHEYVYVYDEVKEHPRHTRHDHRDSDRKPEPTHRSRHDPQRGVPRKPQRGHGGGEERGGDKWEQPRPSVQRGDRRDAAQRPRGIEQKSQTISVREPERMGPASRELPPSSEEEEGDEGDEGDEEDVYEYAFEPVQQEQQQVVRTQRAKSHQEKDNEGQGGAGGNRENQGMGPVDKKDSKKKKEQSKGQGSEKATARSKQEGQGKERKQTSQIQGDKKMEWERGREALKEVSPSALGTDRRVRDGQQRAEIISRQQAQNRDRVPASGSDEGDVGDEVSVDEEAPKAGGPQTKGSLDKSPVKSPNKTIDETVKGPDKKRQDKDSKDVGVEQKAVTEAGTGAEANWTADKFAQVRKEALGKVEAPAAVREIKSPPLKVTTSENKPRMVDGATHQTPQAIKSDSGSEDESEFEGDEGESEEESESEESASVGGKTALPIADAKKVDTKIGSKVAVDKKIDEENTKSAKAGEGLTAGGGKPKKGLFGFFKKVEPKKEEPKTDPTNVETKIDNKKGDLKVDSKKADTKAAAPTTGGAKALESKESGSAKAKVKSEEEESTESESESEEEESTESASVSEKVDPKRGGAKAVDGGKKPELTVAGTMASAKTAGEGVAAGGGKPKTGLFGFFKKSVKVDSKVGDAKLSVPKADPKLEHKKVDLEKADTKNVGADPESSEYESESESDAGKPKNLPSKKEDAKTIEVKRADANKPDVKKADLKTAGGGLTAEAGKPKTGLFGFFKKGEAKKEDKFERKKVDLMKADTKKVGADPESSECESDSASDAGKPKNVQSKKAELNIPVNSEAVDPKRAAADLLVKKRTAEKVGAKAADAKKAEVAAKPKAGLFGFLKKAAPLQADLPKVDAKKGKAPQESESETESESSSEEESTSVSELSASDPKKAGGKALDAKALPRRR